MINTSKRTIRCISLAAATLPMATAAIGADYRITASGTFSTATPFSETFDGTVFGELPPLLDVSPLEGGSFNATFQFSTVTPTSGAATTAFYEIPGESNGMTFDLFDSSGQLVQHGSNRANAVAILSDNSGGAPYTVDQVLLSSDIDGLAGTNFPAPLYTPPGEVLSVADFSWYGNVSGGANYIADLSIPIDAATYMGFPTRSFDVYLSFFDGDPNAVGPYQYADLLISYDITTLSVTEVPEPGSAFMLASVLLGLTARARRRSFAADAHA
jgi:hypothetical protein